MRFLGAFLTASSAFFAPFIICWSLLAIIYGGLTTCRQVDLKRTIAYSSVAHMGLVSLAIFSHSIQGLVAAILLMLGHGLVSSALFISITFLYDRFSTRLIKYYRGLVISMPLFGLFFFLLVLSNASIPLSCSFIGEVLTLLAALEFSFIGALLASTGMVLSAAYSIYVYNRICFGLFSKSLSFARDLNRSEYFSLLPLVSLIVLIGVFPFLAIDVVYGSILFQEWG